jgi:hypothetical protein
LRWVAVNFLLDGWESAEEEVAGVSHDGGAARGDLVVGLELIEFAEGVIDIGGGAEFLDVADEGGGDVGLVEIFPALGGVLEAEAGVGIKDGHAATTTAGGALLTVRQSGVECSCGADRFWIHKSSFLGILDTHPAVFVRVANKGVAGYGTWKKIRRIGGNVGGSESVNI